MEKYLKRIPKSAMDEHHNESAGSSKRTRSQDQNNLDEIESDASCSSDLDNVESEVDKEVANSKATHKILYKQKIRKNWLNDPRFCKWLVIKDDNLSCKYCLCTLQPKLSGLLAHLKRKKHIKAVAPFLTGQQPSVNFSHILTQNETKRATLLNAIYTACHTSVNSINHLTLLQKKTFSDSEIARNLQLGRTKCSKLIENVLCPYFKKELRADIGDGFFSLIIDESTDISVKKQLGVIIRYYSKSSRSIVNTFLKLIELEDSTAKAIANAILITLEEFKLSLKNFKGLGTDNANAMVGVNKGVIALLKQKNPNIILVPCVCHSVQLAVSSASKCIPNEIEYLISESYNWFAKSPSRQNCYHTLYSSLNNGQEPHKLVRACETRWLSIEIAVKRIVDQWFELKAHFGLISSKHQCYKAKHLSDLYTDCNLAYLLFLKPVLGDVQKVNKSFESNSADPTKLFSDLKFLLHGLCFQIVIQCKEFDPLSSPIENYLMSSPHFSYTFEEHMRDKIKNGLISEDSEKIIRQKCQSFINKLIEQLRQRLPANMKTLRKIDFLSVDNTLKIVKPNIFFHIDSEKCNYTADEITKIEAQWRNILNYKWTNIESTIDFWVEVREFKNALQENPFSDLVNLVFNFLVLPLSNAEVERLFSAMKMVKTKQRNRIKVKMLNALLNIRFSLKRLHKCCHDFEISDDLLKFLDSCDIYANSSSDSSDDDEIIIPVL